ncbi:RNA polymerase subunit sigma-70 [Desertihabitans brevis]|uniref:RNA polymerase subunit sigma-70 n=1 Tax=Desertihabitans brevis TaxID=2268447 RepID=A0A367YRV5_9ACTN|nr:sigma-70 family RNA polymerase sigma factor [Desertihabitans brevis]RCK68626.1 RNA polymerase subunit sigma-70 [Desertihabitans brevis]
MVDEDLAEQFEQRRPRLHALASRLLGSTGEADDAVQETWLRLQRQGAGTIDNLDGWLTTVLARVCLNLLRARRTRGEQELGPLEGAEPVDAGPEEQALLADSVGLALLVVLDALGPAERLGFVLHDVFAVPFTEIAPVIDKTPAATRQLVSRARRKVRGRAPVPDADGARQRAVVEAFLAAAHHGDFERLVELMHPDVVLRSEGGRRRRSASMVVRGARPVAVSTRTYAGLAPSARVVLVDAATGVVGVVVAPGGEPFSVMAFTVVDGRISAIDVLADPDHLAASDATGRSVSRW